MISKVLQIWNDEAARGLLLKGLNAVVIKGGSAALTFLMFVLLSNVMTADEFGRFAIGLSLAITLSMVAGLGLATAVLRFVPEYRSKTNEPMALGFLRYSSLASVVSPAIIGLLGAAVIFVAVTLRPETPVQYLYASMVLLVVMTLGEYVASALRAFGATVMSLAPRDIFWRIAGCGFALYVFWQGTQVSSSTVLYFLTACLALLIFTQILYARAEFAAAFSSQPTSKDLRTWRRVALPMWGAATLYAFAQQFDIVVVGYFLTPAQSAPYFAASRTAAILSLLLIAGNLISAPLISRYHYAGDNAGMQKTVRLLTTAIAFPTLCGLLLLVFVGKPLLALFNPTFVSAYPILLILAVGFTFDAVAGPTGYMLQMVGHEKAYLKIMAIAYAFTLLFQCVLAPFFGAVGVAIPSALGLILANILIVHKVRRTLHIDPSLFGIFFKVRTK
jgi:O-antigen/teichoic acid export membrane protein